MLEFVIESDEDRPVFEQRWCGAPVAMKDVRLQAREPGGDVLAGALDRQTVESVRERFLTMLIVPPDSVGVMIGRSRLIYGRNDSRCVFLMEM